MEPISDGTKLARLWEAAIRSAAGPLSAILTPETYGLSVLKVSNLASSSIDPFQVEIAGRISLGCAVHCLELLQTFERELTSSYRHEILLSSAAIDGKIVVPRLVVLRANGDRHQVPTVKARRQLVTPENLLASEMLSISQRVLQYWKGRGGAEAKLAGRLLLDYQRVAARRPWSELASYPRETLSILAAFVLSRIKSGWNRPDSTIAAIAHLALGKSPGDALELAAGSLSFLATQDDRFADKMFELLCLGWFHQIAKADLDEVHVEPKGMRSGTLPLMKTKLSKLGLNLFFQHRLGYRTLWTWGHTGKSLEAIPDVILTISDGDDNRVLLIDAKNRSTASESEVAYKLLGYKENLDLSPYTAIAIFPEFERQNMLVRSLTSGANRVLLARIPILSSEERLRVFARTIWRQINLTPPTSQHSGETLRGLNDH